MSRVGRKKTVRHDSLGFAFVKKLLAGKLVFENGERLSIGDVLPPELNHKVLSLLLEITCGHHGKPPQLVIGSIKIPVPSHYYPEDAVAAKEFIGALSFLLPEHLPTSLQERSTADKIKQMSWSLSGICILCDWLGSDQFTFRYANKPMLLDDYWHQRALPCAEKMVQKHKLNTLVEPQPFSSVQALFPFIQEPTPLQAFCAEVTIGIPHMRGAEPPLLKWLKISC